MSTLAFFTLIPEPLQHALIVADNVADSEDSEDEWDYYRVDPKQESAAIATNESRKDIEKQSQENLESVAKDNSEIQSPEAENDIKCEEVKDTSSPKLINIDVSLSCRFSHFFVVKHLLFSGSMYFE